MTLTQSIAKTLAKIGEAAVSALDVCYGSFSDLGAQLRGPLYLNERTSSGRFGRSEKYHKRTMVRPRSYFGLRGNGMNPSRFGILTLGSDCASITSFDPTIPLRLRI